jgi:hypothetical protein
MSFWANVFWANVFLGIRLSFWANVFLGKCLSKQMSSGQMSFWANVFWANVHLGKCLSGQMYSGQMYSGQMSSGQMSFWTNVSGQMSLGKCCMGKYRITVENTLQRDPQKAVSLSRTLCLSKTKW